METETLGVPLSAVVTEHRRHLRSRAGQLDSPRELEFWLTTQLSSVQGRWYLLDCANFFCECEHERWRVCARVCVCCDLYAMIVNPLIEE